MELVLDALFCSIKTHGYITNDIVTDKHSGYKPGDRAIWKDGIYEKGSNGKWNKIAGLSKPFEIQGKNGLVKFEINKKHFEADKKKLKKQIIATIKSNEFKSPTGKEAKEKAKLWLKNNIGNEIKTEIGNVRIDDNCIDNSFGHGAYPAKYDTVKAIAPILKNGVYMGKMKDIDGSDINNYYFTGKIKLDGKEKYIFCRIRESLSGNTGKRFYLHSVYTEDDIKRGAANKTAPALKGKNNRGAPLELTLIQNFLNCN